jgi:hypothetical protein
MELVYLIFHLVIGHGEKRPLGKRFVDPVLQEALTSSALTAAGGNDEQKLMVSACQGIYCPIMSLSFQYRIHKAKPDVFCSHSHQICLKAIYILPYIHKHSMQESLV